MNAALLLLRYQVLVERERVLRERIGSAEARLESDPAVVELEAALVSAREGNEAAAASLRDSDREREAHRSRLRTREKELMSGRIRNPTELMQMSHEVAGMKASFAQEEEAELRLMEDVDAAEEAVRTAQARLDEARKVSQAEEPELREQLEEARAELGEVEGERDAVWADVPAPDQAAFNRVRARPAVARVANNQCSACRVTVTSSGMQILRKGDALVNCEHCSRILVAA